MTHVVYVQKGMAWRGLLALLLLLMLAGCGQSKLVKPIGDFQKATAAAAGVVKPAYQQMNQVEREYDVQVALDEDKVINAKEFLEPDFSLKGIRARLEAFQAIELYTLRLAQLADAETWSTIPKAAGAVGEQVKSLGSNLKLDGNGGDPVLNALPKLFTAVAELWVAAYREKLLREAINKASPQVEKVLGLMEGEVHRIQQSRMDVLLEKAALALDTYNDTSQPRNVRRAALGAALELAGELEMLKLTDYADVIRKMRMAHVAMVAAAGSGDEGSREVFEANVQVFLATTARAAGWTSILSGNR